MDIDEDLFKQRVSATGQLIGVKSSEGIGKVRIMTHIHSYRHNYTLTYTLPNLICTNRIY